MKWLHLLFALAAALRCSGAELGMDPALRLENDEKQAWGLFSAGVEALQEIGDRGGAADLFARVFTEFPNSRYAADSHELAAGLRVMIEEDNRWVEPTNPKALRIDEQVAYYTHHLRDVHCHQFSQPGMCDVCLDLGPGAETNAAIKLKEIGEPAIPALIKLLTDRRPTRSVGFWRNFSPERTVLRYQDAAIQILGELLPTAFYEPQSTYAYLSMEPPEVRERVIASVKAWYEKSRGKSEAEKKWLAVEAKPGIHQVIGLLRSLGSEPSQKERVMANLQQMCRESDPLHLPKISELMCELGDRSKVGEVIAAYVGGQYDTGRRLPDDPAAGMNAEDSALRQAILYGTDAQRRTLSENAARHLGIIDPMAFLDTLKRPTKNGSVVFDALLDAAGEHFYELPKTYDRSQFPLWMLVEALTNKTERTNWGTRRGDAAADAIQRLTKMSFGYDLKGTEEEKDKAIQRIMDWWKERARKPTEAP